MTSAVGYVRLAAMSCTASWWFLIPGLFLALGSFSVLVDELKGYADANDVPGCCAAVLGLIAGIALTAVGVNSFADGCN
ncbi:hypothetical protein ACFVZD_36780 [Streptomyces sp. NPDC058287]|uniref:hypothetical protein n=1 Tax=Streptomyces sp. NPDC058287 TaxID=3346423 RepID=UPI0036E2E220